MVESTKTIALGIDPSGAETGGRAVKRALQEVGQAAVQVQQQIDRATGVTQGAQKSARDSAAALGAELDNLRAKYNPVFAVVQRYKTAQDEIRTAHKLGALSTNEMSAALARERREMLDGIAIAKQKIINLDAIRAQYDQVFAAQKRYESAVTGVNEAERLGAISGSQAIQARLRETNALRAQISVLNNVANARKREAESAVQRRLITPDRGSDIAAYGAELDALRKKFNPLYAVAARYRSVQEEIRQAHRVGAISTNEMSAALSRERRSALTSISALKGRSVALEQMSKATSRAAAYQRQLSYQLFDIGQAIPLAFQSPLYALQNFGFQSAQIAQLYMGRGGINQALRDTAGILGPLAERFLRVGAVAGPAALAAIAGIESVRSQVKDLTGETATYGEVFVATFQVIGREMRNAVGPQLDWLQSTGSYIFKNLGSAAVDWAELVINSFRAVGYDAAFAFDQIPNVIGSAFVEGVNAAIDALNTLSDRITATVNYYIQQINRIPGVDIGAASNGFSVDRIANTFSQALSQATEQRNAAIANIMQQTPVRDFGASVAAQVRGDRGLNAFNQFSSLDFSGPTQGANGLSTAMQSVGKSAGTAYNQIVDFQRQAADASLSTLASMRKLDEQLRAQKDQFKAAGEGIAAALRDPLSKVFDSAGAGGVFDQGVATIQKLFAAMDNGTATARTVFDGIEMVRQSLKQVGVDAKSVDSFVDKLTNANIKLRETESNVKSLSDAIRNIPNRDVSVTVTTYKVDGGTVNVSRPTGATSALDNRTAGLAAPGVSSSSTSGGSTDAWGRTTATDAWGNAVSTSDIPKMAVGGIVTQSTIANIGEAGPEAVVPLAGGTIPVTLGGGSFGAIETNTAAMLDRLTALVSITETFSSDILAVLNRIKASYSYGGASGVSSGSSALSMASETLPQSYYYKTGVGGIPVVMSTGQQTAYMGFDTGGVLHPSGSGNTDSRYVQIVTRPDETATINTPRQRQGVVDLFDRQYERGFRDGSPSVTLNGGITVVMRGDGDPRQAAQTIFDEFNAKLRSASPLHGRY